MKSGRHRRVVVTRHGGPDVLQVVTSDTPEPGPGEVRVRVRAAGVSLPDVLMREAAAHPETRRTPYTPGWEIVGVVEAIGADVSGVEIGATVAALPIVGGYAEVLCLPACELVAVPAGLDPGAAVSLVLNYVTAYQMLHRSAQVQAGECMLVHAAAGGVGTALLELGRLAELRMLGTASRRKHEIVSRLGATPIDYQSEDFLGRVRDLTGGEGADVALDGIGGAHVLRSYRALQRGGRLVAYGLTGTLSGGRRSLARVATTVMGYGALLSLNLLPDGRSAAIYSIQLLKRRRPRLFREDLGTLLGLLRDGQLQPVIAARFPLEQAAEAQELLVGGTVAGKIVLDCPDSPSR